VELQRLLRTLTAAEATERICGLQPDDPLYADVLAVAKASGKFDAAKLAEAEKFMHDPAGWSKAHGGAAAIAAE